MKCVLTCVLSCPLSPVSYHLDVVGVVEGEPVVNASRERDHVSLAHLYPHPLLILRANVEEPAT